MLISNLLIAANLAAAEPPPAQQQDKSDSAPNLSDIDTVEATQRKFANDLGRKKTLAQAILLAAYKNSLNILTSPHRESLPSQRRMLNRMLGNELSKLLTDIKNSDDVMATHAQPEQAEPEELDIEEPRNTLTIDRLVGIQAPSSLTAAVKTPSIGDNYKFPWPITGDISSTPGSALREGGAKWPGMLIQTKPGAKVQSIASGKVVYAGKMKNLGLLVIVNHQDGHLSLYGKNSKIFVAQGQEVRKNQTIAIIEAQPDSTEVGLYFEIRRNGKPVDPRLLCSNALNVKP